MSREREIANLQQHQCEAERDINEVLSHAVQSAETQRREYEDQLKQLQSELAEHQLKAAMLEQNRQPLSATAEQLGPDTPVSCLLFFYFFLHSVIHTSKLILIFRRTWVSQFSAYYFVCAFVLNLCILLGQAKTVRILNTFPSGSSDISYSCNSKRTRSWTLYI